MGADDGDDILARAALVRSSSDLDSTGAAADPDPGAGPGSAVPYQRMDD